MTEAQPTSIQALEADLAARRERLARTVDELASKASPQALVARQKAAAKQRLIAATRTPEGDLRVERIAAAVGVVAVFVSLRIWSARRRKRR